MMVVLLRRIIYIFSFAYIQFVPGDVYIYIWNMEIYICLGKMFQTLLREKFSSIKLILKFSVDSLPIIYFNIFTSPILAMCFYTLYYSTSRLSSVRYIKII